MAHLYDAPFGNRYAETSPGRDPSHRLTPACDLLQNRTSGILTESYARCHYGRTATSQAIILDGRFRTQTMVDDACHRAMTEHALFG